jgi:peptidoglycan hydrolase-like protein with peptidoglycan-binding domain
MNLRLSDNRGALLGRTFDGTGYGRSANTDHVRDGQALLMRGQGGQSVAQLQRQLSVLGYMQHSDIDGRFGPATERAVREFQKANGLPEDGIVGRASYDKLFGTAPAVAAVNPVSGNANTPQETARVEARLAALDRRPTPSAATELTQAPWARKDVTDFADQTRARAGRGAQVLDRLGAELNTLPVAQRQEVQGMIDQLRQLYSRLDGSYVTTDGRNSDAQAAADLERRITGALTAPRRGGAS